MAKEKTVANFIGGEFCTAKTSETIPVTNPATGEVIGQVPLCDKTVLDDTVQRAAKAQVAWGDTPVKERVQVMFKFKELLEKNVDDLAALITKENGKTDPESRGSILRAIECVEFASSMPQMIPGGSLEVSKGVECKYMRQPLGVVAGITPFNFPLMVPLWMVPNALTCGNSFVLKPSEQTPYSSLEIGRLLKEAGLPDGVFSVVQGGKDMVEAICDNPEIKAVGFVGSTKVARIVYARAAASGKRVRALGGAKNHLILVPDADPEMAASNIVASVAGCAGQRCMAASVLLAVGDVDHVIQKIKEKMEAIVPGKDIGPIISKTSLERIESYLERAEAGGAKLMLDGRQAASEGSKEGFFIGASIIDNATPDHESSCDEIFGPVLTIIRCKSLEEAIEIENQNPYGNAAAIYTSSGQAARHFSEKASAGMIGVNIGVPVPREPFGFGGWRDSNFGDGDITGTGAIDFWSGVKKVTTKWSAEGKANWMS